MTGGGTVSVKKGSAFYDNRCNYFVETGGDSVETLRRKE